MEFNAAENALLNIIINLFEYSYYTILYVFNAGFDQMIVNVGECLIIFDQQ